ncbi:aminoacyl-tRNA hydrolase [Maridesulfovibrio hydrothermalis]|uniref:Peptidyl-tRNA hydrolase n=1 Tax=Maridesulfovibrio hydrothermalis AM13 = DSM 14728 TaxID=1121451 RepID=L0RF68_9BACT|nr:aminoacyl-tRNA hydrolase [Maridesulfovibrio hydrothermalis]CCO25403.1 Peptidyl-tRNA hydrolase [Maridesulfovibrio hydrothermalis AM13 = DSM 14728]
MEYKALIAGLGNPGSEYAKTRHNIGFMVVDALEEMASSRKSMRYKKLPGSGDYELFSINLAGNNVLVTKPMTYMNLSGKAVASICGKYSISVNNVFVIHDELDIVSGKMKFKKGGGNNGHRGLESIQEKIGSPDFFRIRIGIGRPEFSSQVKDYVLEEFNCTELETARQMALAAIKGLDLYYRRGQGTATQFMHTFTPDENTTEA